MIAFTCSCNTPLHRHDSEAGAKTICPACGQEYLIPGLSSEEELAGQLLLSMEKDVAARAPIATGVDGAPDRSRAIRFSCPHCSAVIKASVAKAGTRVKCPKCKLTLEVPVARGKLLEDQPRPS
ncbi:MAG: hypothetical protein JNM56_25140, partial [Planctomycetia bacterium]|nr:hypothetical protein [Planctomycetia bacterium]